MSALEHQPPMVGSDPALAVAGAATADTTADRPRRTSWELLLWVLSAALLLSGAALLSQAWTHGSFDTGLVPSTIEADPETGRITSCETENGPCPRTLATNSLAYALAIPALGSGTTGLLLAIALRARRAAEPQSPQPPHPHAQPQSPQPRQTDPRPELAQEAPARSGRPAEPRDAHATPRPARSLRDATIDSFAPFMPPGQQPPDDPQTDGGLPWTTRS